MQQFSLFTPEEICVPIEDRIEKALEAIRALFEARTPVVIAYSGGKDSSAVAALAFHAAVQYRDQGGNPFLVVTTSDTLVESPEVTQHFRAEIRKMEKFANALGIRLETAIVQPTLLTSWQVKILSGRGAPSFAGMNTDCTTDLKITPQKSYRNKLFARFVSENLPTPVTLLGTRFTESEARAQKMKERGDRADEPVKNTDGDLILSPIAFWSTEDVFEAIALYGAGMKEYPSFSNFKEMLRLYAHSAGTSCAVVAEAIYEGLSKRKKGGCGTRLGCWVCQQARDKSLENMIAFDERYEYAIGLNKLNHFIRNTRHDWSLRHFVGRKIIGGYIAIQPDTYHPRMIRALTRYMLQLDYDERIRAENAGIAPMFQILPLELMIAVDAMQSLNGLAKPFQIWADYDEIVHQGIRYDIPDIPAVKPTNIPDARFLYVGGEWDNSEWGGLRDATIESLLDGSPCAPDLTKLSNGHIAWEFDTEGTFNVDTESAAMIFEFEYDRLLEMHRAGYMPGGITAGYFWYLQYGVISLQHANQSGHDEVCRRTAFKDRFGLTLEYDIDDLLSKSIRFADLPLEAARLWHKKATTGSAQNELLLAA